MHDFKLIEVTELLLHFQILLLFFFRRQTNGMREAQGTNTKHEDE